MKYKLLLIAFTLLVGANLQATNSSQEGYKIEISAPSFIGSTAYFASYWAGSPYTKDSIRIPENGVVTFSGKESLPTGQYLLFISPSFQLELLIDEKEQSDIKINIPNEDIFKSNISGSNDTKLFWQYLIDMQKEEDSPEKHISKYLRSHQDTWFTSFIRATQSVGGEPHPNPSNDKQHIENLSYLREHYFDNISFTDERLWRTSFFLPLINTYLEQWIPQHPDTIAQKSSWIVSQTQTNAFCFENMLTQLVNQATKSKVMGMENIWARLAEDYIFDKNISWIDSAQYSDLKMEYSLIELNRVGMKAQNLTLTTIEGDTINTNDIEADYVLLFFHTTSCSYCSREIEKLTNDFLPKFNDLNLKIVAINTEQDDQRWREYIEQHKMGSWINAADPNFSSKYWLKYDVSGTPSIYLLNKDKTIIAKKIDTENLIKYLELIKQ